MIGAACLDRQWHVDTIEDAKVKCIRPGVPSSLVMLGPRGARWAVIVDFTIIEAGGETRVQVADYIESENTFGGKRVHSQKPEGDPDAGLALLRSIGGETGRP